MRSLPFTAVLVLALGACTAESSAPPATTAAASATAVPARLGLCVACHGADGISRIPGTPHLAGQDETYLRKALADYRAGRRNGGPMSAVAGSLAQDDLAALAAYYAALPPKGAH